MTLKINQPASSLQRRLQKIEYIREMLVELKTAASVENELLLVYFLEMAFFEASDAISNMKKSPVKVSDGNKSSGMSM